MIGSPVIEGIFLVGISSDWTSSKRSFKKASQDLRVSLQSKNMCMA